MIVPNSFSTSMQRILAGPTGPQEERYTRIPPECVGKSNPNGDGTEDPALSLHSVGGLLKVWENVCVPMFLMLHASKHAGFPYAFSTQKVVQDLGIALTAIRGDPATLRLWEILCQ
eukprot:1143399-Pelagomonas_calceolata.AAC.4